MQRRTLGKSGYDISTIGLGTWAVGGHMWGGQEEAQSAEAIHAAVDHGINWIDTAPIYGSGFSEEVVGRAVKQLPASKRPLIFTKFGLGINSDAPTRSASAADVASECDASLRRLGVDHIDLYQLHWPAPQPIAETAAACAALLTAGKIRAIGVSNFSARSSRSGSPPGCRCTPISRRTASCARRQSRMSCRGAPRTTSAPSRTRRSSAACSSARGRRTRPSLPATDGARTRTTQARASSGTCKPSTRSGRSRPASGLSVPQLCVGVLLQTPGLTGVIVGARSARQGGVISSLAVSIAADQAAAVWAIAGRWRRTSRRCRRRCRSHVRNSSQRRQGDQEARSDPIKSPPDLLDS